MKRISKVIIFIILMVIVSVIIFGIKIVPVKDRILCANLPEQIYVYSEDNYYAFLQHSVLVLQTASYLLFAQVF